MKNSEILSEVNKMNSNTLMETLKIEFTEIGENYVVCKMPVTSEVHQPAGILHGGATAALVETVGSFASRYFIKNKDLAIRGIEISTNHIKSISNGFVYAKATNIHLGRTMQIWEVKVTDENENLISLGKLTTLAINKK
ncbi:MAG: PaaI family thioesterase [Flavobacteriaceae bacterium]